jgi:hypothetical protein
MSCVHVGIFTWAITIAVAEIERSCISQLPSVQVLLRAGQLTSPPLASALCCSILNWTTVQEADAKTFKIKFPVHLYRLH